MITGIDVSAYVPDWGAWKRDRGISFGLVKATEGAPGERWDFDEPSFDANWAGLARAGLRRFAYHYGHPSADPSAQARFLTKVVHAAGLKRGDNFVLDLETTDGMHPVQVSFWAYVFCHQVNALNPGHRVLVYTNPAFAEAGNCAKLGNWALWLADWGVSRPVVPPPWKTYRLWQHAAGGNVDFDEWRGTREQFDNWTVTSG